MLNKLSLIKYPFDSRPILIGSLSDNLPIAKSRLFDGPGTERVFLFYKDGTK